MYNIRHKKEERADLDYYSTDPDSVRALLAVEKFNTNILEPVGGLRSLTPGLFGSRALSQYYAG